ncbi:MAG TPA: 2-C-methyl-D-erythritol 2,4-cyclodiphosphate synthase, partial [Gemmatimonadaceae bacterium]|nr:2-C-methyl-D-erythritol 2,4-cyclodiphosphate synthase [Gemmatimonadaceae bacterium]
MPREKRGKTSRQKTSQVDRSHTLRVGIGYDSHRYAPSRPLLLGGVLIPNEAGLAGHSDGDAICHAVTDAILGAAALGDIGEMFPNSDPKWKSAASRVFVETALH